MDAELEGLYEGIAMYSFPLPELSSSMKSVFVCTRHELNRVEARESGSRQRSKQSNRMLASCKHAWRQAPVVKIYLVPTDSRSMCSKRRQTNTLYPANHYDL